MVFINLAHYYGKRPCQPCACVLPANSRFRLCTSLVPRPTLVIISLGTRPRVRIFLAPVTLTCYTWPWGLTGWMGAFGGFVRWFPWVGSSSHLGIWRLCVSVLSRIPMDRGLQLLHVVLERVQRCFVSFGGGWGLQGVSFSEFIEFGPERCHFILELLNNCPLTVLSTNQTDKRCRLRPKPVTPGYARTVPVHIGLADFALKWVLRGRVDGFATKVTLRLSFFLLAEPFPLSIFTRETSDYLLSYITVNAVVHCLLMIAPQCSTFH